MNLKPGKEENMNANGVAPKPGQAEKNSEGTPSAVISDTNKQGESNTTGNSTNVLHTKLNKTDFETENGNVIFNLNEHGEVKSILFDLGYEVVIHSNTGTMEHPSELDMSIIRTWINILLLGDFEQGLLEGDIIVNNAHIPGSTKPAGYRLNPDGNIDQVFCYYKDVFSFQPLKDKYGKYRAPWGCQHELRAIAAFMFFTTSNTRLISVGDNFRAWCTAVLQTLQLDAKFWPVVRSLKTSEVIADKKAYQEEYKPLRVAYKAAEEEGSKAVAKLAAQVAETLNDMDVVCIDGNTVKGSDIDWLDGKANFSHPSGVLNRTVKADDPAVVQTIKNLNSRGYGLRIMFIKPEAIK
jgi:hypothetical protein